MSETVNEKVETTKEPVEKKSSEKKPNDKQSGISKFFKGLKSDFKKITWPNRDIIIKQTSLVVVVAVLLGIIISIVDVLIKTGFKPIL